MTLSEKLYALRKKRGLSQEQLAEQLNVSRQAISKWESGLSTPESEKLLLISNYFQVSLDYLLKEEVLDALPTTQNVKNDDETKREFNLAGLIICVGGVLLLILWGLLSILNPSASNQIGGSSVIQIDGNGMVLILCVVAVIVGAWLLVKGSNKR